MKTIHFILTPIKRFDQWFSQNFSWFFTNGYKCQQDLKSKEPEIKH